jgi:hypothetical protein
MQDELGPLINDFEIKVMVKSNAIEIVFKSFGSFMIYQQISTANLAYFYSKTTVLAALIKGRIEPKAKWRASDSLKKRINEFVWFFCCENQKNKFVLSFFHFLGDSTARQSTYGFI